MGEEEAYATKPQPWEEKKKEEILTQINPFIQN
jgi:hypothetical protein